MANNGIAIRDSHAGQDVASRLVEFAFGAFLLLVFVGLQPFAIRDPNVLVNGDMLAAGEGDLVRQMLYLLFFAMIFIRRVGLEVIVVLSVMLSVNALGADRAFRVLRLVLALVLIVNWLSIPIVPQAVHLADETDPSIVGDWRGLYFHKNITGAVCALSAMAFLYYAIRDKSRTDWILLIATLGFLVMTRSKSSIGLLPLGIGAGALYYCAWRRGIDRAIVSVGVVLVILFAADIAGVYHQELARIFSDPQEFTGRTVI